MRGVVNRRGADMSLQARGNCTKLVSQPCRHLLAITCRSMIGSEPSAIRSASASRRLWRKQSMQTKSFRLLTYSSPPSTISKISASGPMAFTASSKVFVDEAGARAQVHVVAQSLQINFTRIPRIIGGGPQLHLQAERQIFLPVGIGQILDGSLRCLA